MRGLLAIEPLYHQIVAGNKTQTRRSGGLEEVNNSEHDWEIVGGTVTHQSYPADTCGVEEVIFRTKEYIPAGEVAGKLEATCKPRYKVGEILYLKEPVYFEYLTGPGVTYVHYKYNHADESRDIEDWQNKMFMPAHCARVFIQITGIKCERLLDISDEDCIAEGIETRLAEGGIMDKIFKFYPDNGWLLTPRPSFISLYRFANKISPKKDIGNPWVWAYTFKTAPKP